jgi:hypothetical protein
LPGLAWGIQNGAGPSLHPASQRGKHVHRQTRINWDETRFRYNSVTGKGGLAEEQAVHGAFALLSVVVPSGRVPPKFIRLK